MSLPDVGAGTGVIEEYGLALVLPVLLPLGLALVGCLVLERWQIPKSASLWRRPWWANVALVLFTVGLFGFFFALTQRPWLTMALTIAISTLLVLVNNAKYEHLREPFLACDFIYFWEAIRYPQLYLPYFGYGRAALLLLAFLAILGTWLWLEPALGDGLMSWPIVTGALVALVAWLLAGLLAGLVVGSVVGSAFGAVIASPDSSVSSDDPTDELRRWGLVAMLLRHLALQRQTRPSLQTPFLNLSGHTTDEEPSRQLPHFVCVQAESFFDVRRVYPDFVPNDWLTQWDGLRANAVASGTLAVPAWGANTVRSEFAFLTGIADASLGVHRFQPYQMLLKSRAGPETILSLPRWLKGLGYQTRFVHPYLPAFYARNKVLPLLGFDEFIDIHAFQDHPRHSGYVTDTALAQRVTGVLNAATDPLFLHVVTMQGHGPYGPMDSSPQAALDQYLDRMRHTDQMLQILRHGFAATPRPVVLCVFGDHLPILPTVYDWLGTPEANTDYLIWSSDREVADDSLPSGNATKGHPPIAAKPRSPTDRSHLRLDELAIAMLAAGGFGRPRPTKNAAP